MINNVNNIRARIAYTCACVKRGHEIRAPPMRGVRRVALKKAGIKTRRGHGLCAWTTWRRRLQAGKADKRRLPMRADIQLKKIDFWSTNFKKVRKKR